MPPPSRRFWSLDALRGLCALVVFLSHWILWAQFRPASGVERALSAILHGGTSLVATLAWPLGGNHPAVICFFVLSGFCIHHPFARDAARGVVSQPWRRFYRRRFLRIMPVYWVAALAGFAFVSAQRTLPTDAALLAFHADVTPGKAVLRLLGLTDFYPHEILAGNGPLVTVGIEILLYAAYPLFYAQTARGRWVTLGSLFVALEFIGLLLLPGGDAYWIYNSILMYGVFWYAGALAAHWHTTRPSRAVGRELLLAWLAFVALNCAPHVYGASVLKQNLWGFVCVLAVLQLLHFEPHRPDLGATTVARALRYAGQVSYSLYAIHTPALLLTTWALLHLGLRSYSLQLALTMAGAVAATLLVHYRIERVFYRPVNPIAADSRSVTPAAVSA